MLTGHDAFAGEDMVAVLYQIVHEEPQPLGRYVGWDCTRVQQVLSRALSKDPTLRFPTIAAFSNALGEAARDADAANDATEAADIVPAGDGALAPPTPTAPSAAAPETFEDLITETIPRVPRLRYRPVVLSLFACALIGLVLATNWGRQLPDEVIIAAHAIKTRVIGGNRAGGGPPPPAEAPTIVHESAPPAPRPLPGVLAPGASAAGRAAPAGNQDDDAPPRAAH